MTASRGTRVDLHVKVLDERVVERAKAAGLDVLVYAPHFTHLSTIRERASAHSDDELLVVPGRECFTGPWHDRRHVLAVAPDEPIPDFLPFDATMSELERQDAAVLAPHPAFLSVSVSRADVLAHREIFDAVETYCPKHWWWHTERARSIAEAADLPGFASSYAHLRSTVGAAWITVERPIETAADLTAALSEGAGWEIGRGEGPRHRLQSAAEFAHLGWENSWQKFARVVLGGREATHPRHRTYEGRFAELSVY